MLLPSYMCLFVFFDTLFFFFKDLSIYLWLCWIFVAVLGLSLVAASGGYSGCGAQAYCSGFSCC